jgi:DNA helicase-2/ATP-dependent DNA helicase PcrA
MDFDDLLTKTQELFLTHPEIAQHYQQQFRAILVDEYQDTNSLQANLIDILATLNQNIMVVGVDAQSIYSWRGSNVSNILDFPKRYPSAQFFPIETNYRSVPQILQLANASIFCNPQQFPKELQAIRSPYVRPPARVALATNIEQASFIGQRLMELHKEGIPFAEMAVLYRAHYHSMEIQMELTRRGIPFLITSGLRFFEQAHIKDVAAMMKFVLNPNDEVAFKRLVALFRGIGKKTSESLWKQTREKLEETNDFQRLKSCKLPAKAAREWKQWLDTILEITHKEVIMTPSTMIETIMIGFYEEIMKERFTNYDVRLEDLKTLINYSKQFSQTSDFLAELTLLGENETNTQKEEDQVYLSSIHQAKGLEWRVVFIIWLTEGMFPTLRSLSEASALEEERRLFYVAVTRCKEDLYLTYPELRLNAHYGEAFQRPSRFLEELKHDLYDRWDISLAM